ncbi:hypothetical protein Tco_0165003 [Tanacetum coccineum]
MEEAQAQLSKIKRLADLKAGKEKSEKALLEIMNPVNIQAQAKKMAEYEAKRAKMLAELKQLGFNEWIEIQALASNEKAGKLGLPPPPELLASGLTAVEKKRKRTSEILKEVFVTEDIRVDEMHRNLIPPPGVVGSKGLVIT